MYGLQRVEVTSVRRAALKVKLLTGTYMLQAVRSKYSGGKIDPLCPICRNGAEDTIHFLLRCTALGLPGTSSSSD